VVQATRKETDHDQLPTARDPARGIGPKEILCIESEGVSEHSAPPAKARQTLGR
jgi:hypothetical protein